MGKELKIAKNFEGRSIERHDGEHMPATKISRNTEFNRTKKCNEIE